MPTSNLSPARRALRWPPKPQLLHVERDDTCADMLATLLAPDVEVTRATTLAEARELAATRAFSLVVIDPILPDGDGMAFVREALPAPVLVHAARPPERARVAAFLPKPWTSRLRIWSEVSQLLQLGQGHHA